MRKESTSSTSGVPGAIRLDSVSEGSSAVGGKSSQAVNKETGTSVNSGRGTTTITTAIISSSSTSASSTTSGASSMPSSLMGNSNNRNSGPGGGAYGYHHSVDDEESAFEKSMDSLENMNPLQFEVLETTV